MVTKRERGWSRDKFRVLDSRQPYINQINNKVLLCSAGNYIQYLLINHNGKEYEKEYIYITKSFCYTPETNTTLQIKYACMLSLFSWVQLFVTLWSVAHQVLLSMGISRQEYWSGLTFPSPGYLPDPGIKSRSPVLQADSLPS